MEIFVLLINMYSLITKHVWKFKRKMPVGKEKDKGTTVNQINNSLTVTVNS